MKLTESHTHLPFSRYYPGTIVPTIPLPVKQAPTGRQRKIKSAQGRRAFNYIDIHIFYCRPVRLRSLCKLSPLRMISNEKVRVDGSENRLALRRRVTLRSQLPPGRERHGGICMDFTPSSDPSWNSRTPPTRAHTSPTPHAWRACGSSRTTAAFN